MDLVKIENFTIVVYSKENLAQFRWDGASKSLVNLDQSTSCLVIFHAL
jgi:hypothetical protein